MKLRYLLMSAAIVTSTVGASLAPDLVSADTKKYGDATHATVNGTIDFIKNTDPVDPVDPEDPTNPVDPVDPGNDTGGELMIAYASSLNFGTQSKLETSWYALGDSMTDGSKTVPFVSIADTRGANRNGWTLTAKQDGAFKHVGSNSVLTGATLTLSNLRYAGGSSTAPSAVGGNIVLNSEAVKIASADATKGSGLTSLALGTLGADEEGLLRTNGVKLTIPANSVIETGTYQTSVTYELTAGV